MDDLWQNKGKGLLFFSDGILNVSNRNYPIYNLIYYNLQLNL